MALEIEDELELGAAGDRLLQRQDQLAGLALPSRGRPAGGGVAIVGLGGGGLAAPGGDLAVVARGVGKFQRLACGRGRDLAEEEVTLAALVVGATRSAGRQAVVGHHLEAQSFERGLCLETQGEDIELGDIAGGEDGAIAENL